MSIQYLNGTFQTLDGAELAPLDAAAWSDTARAHGIDNTVLDDCQEGLGRLVVEIEKISQAVGGKALVISSMFRCETLNDMVRGRPTSAHKDARAVDFVVRGLSNDQAIHAMGVGPDMLYDQLLEEHSKSGAAWIHYAVARAGAEPRKMALNLDADTNSGNRIALG